MKRFLIAFACLVAFILVLSSVPTQLFPEFFFYPWLVAKGQIQYRDFFDHHGFLTNMFLAPFAKQQTLGQIRFTFFLMQVAQFLLIARLVADKIKRPLHFLCALVLYGIFQFSVVGNMMWYDQWMALLLVAAWYFFEMRGEGKGWLFFALATMVKPTAVLFFFPFYGMTKNKKNTLFVFAVWLFPLLYYFWKGGLGQLWEQLVMFNTFYVQSTYKTLYLGIGIKLLFSIAIGYGALVLVALLEKKRRTPLAFAFFCSILFFFQGLSKINLAISVPFFILLFADMWQIRKWRLYLGILFVALILILGRDAVKTYQEIRKSKPYVYSIARSEVDQIKKLTEKRGDKNILVLGNRPEIYYLLDILPTGRTALSFPWTEKKYPRSYELNSIYTVLIPKQLGEYESIPSGFLKRLTNRYAVVGQTASYTIWRYNKQ
ncbi:MAG: hypothetical protein WAV30_04435 [Microgenomates group bacterium]